MIPRCLHYATAKQPRIAFGVRPSTSRFSVCLQWWYFLFLGFMASRGDMRAMRSFYFRKREHLVILPKIPGLSANSAVLLRFEVECQYYLKRHMEGAANSLAKRIPLWLLSSKQFCMIPGCRDAPVRINSVPLRVPQFHKRAFPNGRWEVLYPHGVLSASFSIVCVMSAAHR